jgi:hypothetical protein
VRLGMQKRAGQRRTRGLTRHPERTDKIQGRLAVSQLTSMSKNFRIARLTSLVAIILLAGAVSAAAQSLGDVARKEEARRKQVAKSGKVYTNDNLRGGREGVPPAAGAPAAPAPATETPAEAPADSRADSSKDQAHWSGRIKQARENLDRARTFQEALQTRVNSLRADYARWDDPIQRNTIGNNLQKALGELERVNKEIAASEKAIADIEEEARRANVPPGWLRTS